MLSAGMREFSVAVQGFVGAALRVHPAGKFFMRALAARSVLRVARPRYA